MQRRKTQGMRVPKPFRSASVRVSPARRSCRHRRFGGCRSCRMDHEVGRRHAVECDAIRRPPAIRCASAHPDEAHRVDGRPLAGDNHARTAAPMMTRRRMAAPAARAVVLACAAASVHAAGEGDTGGEPLTSASTAPFDPEAPFRGLEWVQKSGDGRGVYFQLRTHDAVLRLPGHAGTFRMPPARARRCSSRVGSRGHRTPWGPTTATPLACWSRPTTRASPTHGGGSTPGIGWRTCSISRCSVGRSRCGGRAGTSKRGRSRASARPTTKRGPSCG